MYNIFPLSLLHLNPLCPLQEWFTWTLLSTIMSVVTPSNLHGPEEATVQGKRVDHEK